METRNILWAASLSNGQTLHEEKGEYKTIAGELSPWQRLLCHIKANNLTITSLSLYSADGHTWNLPSAGKNPKFHAFAAAPQPVGYRFFRKAAKDVRNDGTDAAWDDLYTCIEAKYETGTLQVWVSEEGNAWSVLLPNVN